MASLAKIGFVVKTSDELLLASKVANAYIVLANDIEIGISENFEPDPSVVIDYNGFEIKQVIKTADEFAMMKADGEYALGADITINATWNGGQEITGDVATYVPFTGVLNGQGHTIKTSVPLFARVEGTVQNLVVAGDIAAPTAEIPGATPEDPAVVKNLYSAAVAMYCGGKATFDSITNEAKVAGVVDAAGILAYGSADSDITITGCVNNADITVEGSGRPGAMAACVAGKILIEYCVNNGTISAKGNYGGGILGRIGEGSKPADATIQGCVNNGDVVVKQSQAGGMVGFIDKAVVEITDCTNNGDISIQVGANGDPGGIVGSTTQQNTRLTIKNCTNTGDIFGTNRPGGIAGVIDTNGETLVENCINKGDVTSADPGNYPGGIIARYGWNRDGATLTVKNCENMGAVRATKAQCGGILGYLEGVAVIEDCKNSGPITNNGGVAGGILGKCGTSTANKASFQIINCVNTGEITATNNNVGGIVGHGGAENAKDAKYVVERCVNSGKIVSNLTGKSAPNIAGIMGYAWGGSTTVGITGCLNTGEIVVNNEGTGKPNVASMVAYVNTDRYVVENSINTGMITYNGTTDPNAIALIGYNKISGDDTNLAVAIQFANNASVAISYKGNPLPIALRCSTPVDASTIQNAKPGTAYTVDQIKSGEAVYKLNQAAGEIIFYQDLATGEISLVDNGNNTVYFDGTNYTNTAPAPAPVPAP